MSAAIANDLDRLQASPPGAATRLLLWLLAALVAVLLIWTLTAQLDIVATAPGRLVPTSQVKQVQAAEPGIVRAILVRDGDAVAEGQVLIRMDATLSGADSAALEHEWALKRLTIRAVDAALAGEMLTLAEGDPPTLFAQVQQQFAARRQALDDAVAQEGQAATRARNERLAAVQVRDKLRATLPSYQQSAESFAKLHREGFVGELMANEKRREAIEREQDLKAQEASLRALGAAIAQSEQRMAQLGSNFRSQLLTERVEAQADVEQLTQERAKLGFRSQQMEVRAPAAGVVQGLATYTPGAVVQTGTLLLTVVPKGDRLRVEAALSNEDVGFVAVGQSVKVKLAAFPFQKYGMLEGKVVQVSADAVEAQDAAKTTGASPMAAPALTYKAVIELKDQRLELPGGGSLPTLAGMAVTAEIHQGRRTVMEYLLSPVQRVSSEAGRER